MEVHLGTTPPKWGLGKTCQYVECLCLHLKIWVALFVMVVSET